MIKASGVASGVPFILLGLTEGNVARLKEGKPIYIRSGEVGNDTEIFIIYGKTEDALYHELVVKELITANTIIHREGL